MVQIGGPIGSFLDRVQQRQVPVIVVGTCDYAPSSPPPNPAQLDQHVQTQLLRAIQEVVSRKMERQELTFRHLGTGDVAAVIPEIIGASGLEQSGIRVGNLSMSFGIDGHPPQPPRQPSPGGAPYGQPPPQDNMAAGTFDLGGGQQLQVKINGMTPEGYLKDRASSMIWGWIIGAVIIGVIILTGVGFGIYVYLAAKNPSMGAGTNGVSSGKSWDGKSTLECKGNDKISLTGITASAGVKASANCELTMVGVHLTAPVGVDASGNAKVTMTGGSITASTNSVVAANAAHVELVGTKVTGKSKTSGGAKVSGAP
jgi:hypothetical protein